MLKRVYFHEKNGYFETRFAFVSGLDYRLVPHGVLIAVMPSQPLLPAVSCIGRIAKTEFRPAFGLVVKVAINKNLSFAFRFTADLDEVLRVHSLYLSLLN